MYEDSIDGCECVDCQQERALVLKWERIHGAQDDGLGICPTHYEPECKDCAAGEGYDC